MIVVTSRGGDYSENPAKNFDQQEPYLRTAFGFVGISDLNFIHAQPMDAAGPDVREQKIQAAIQKIKELAL
jgi:FMN-dependent NADH-azoreductase